MPLKVNLYHLDRHEVVLAGELPVAELGIETLDELIRLKTALRYDFEVTRLAASLLLQGRLELDLECQCARCLKTFSHPLRLPAWVCDVPLTGEEAAVVEGDCVDLTPHLREDILLAFPQHPLCKPECPGLTQADPGKASTQSGAKETACPSVWTKLDKLKL
jgi:uncharacterized protein